MPIPPPLVRLLREHLEEFGTAEDGRFSSERGNVIAVLSYSRAWKQARELALVPPTWRVLQRGEGLSRPAWRRPPGTSRLTRYLRGMSVDRSKKGSKIHLLTDRSGLPLPIGISAANTHDSLGLEPLVRGIPPIRSRRGPRRRRPAKLHADKGYDYDHLRQWLAAAASCPG